MTTKVTDCCGVPPKGNSDDYGLCPCCKEHCEYVEEDEEENDAPNRMESIDEDC